MLFAHCTRARTYTPTRAVYVSDPAALLGSADQLAGELAARRIAVVIPYRLGPLFGDARLAPWIDALHARGIRVLAPVASKSRLDELVHFVGDHPSTWFDGLVTEYEFWNHRADRAAAFGELLALLGAMRTTEPAWSRGHTAQIGTYLGYPTAGEARQLAAAIDFAFLDYPVPGAGGAFDHVGRVAYAERWAQFAHVAEWPIFYATGEVDMRADLAREGLDGAEAHFLGDAKPLPAGFVYFTWEALPR
ncbi:MAG TPA: hypothetical protein VGG74_07040 [Kofleriaceae bacterium]|jgi:hypothetical protein